MTWRVGRKVGRTIYKQNGAEPSDGDLLIGVMDYREDALRVVDAVNNVEKYRAALKAICEQSEEHEAYSIAKEALK